MRNILAFENIKILKSKKIYFFIISIFLLIGINLYRNIVVNDNSLEFKLHSIDSAIPQIQSAVDSAKKDLENQKALGNNTTDLEEYIETTMSDLKIRVQQREVLSNENKVGLEYYQLQSELNSKLLDKVSTGKIFMAPEDINNIEKENILLEYFIEHPLVIPEKELSFPLKSWAYLENIMNVLSTPWIIFVLVIFIGSIISKELEEKSFGLFYPIIKNKSQIIYSKLALNFLYIFALIILGISVYMVITGILFGFGSPNYPILIGSQTTDYNAISIISFLLLFLIQYIFVILFLISLALLIGIITKNSVITIGFIILSYYGFIIMKDSEILKFLDPIKSYIPYKYIDGYHSLIESNLGFSGIIILFIFIVINIIFSNLLVKKIVL